MTRIYMATAAGLIAVLLGGLGVMMWLGGGRDPFAACRTSRFEAGVGRIGGPFTLIDGAGKTVTDKDVIKGPTLVYFGYTFCPDVCPVDNARNAEATDILAKRGYDVTPVFISVDPKRDTPQVMREYVQHFSPKMIGLTGTPAEVKAAANAYHVYFKISDPSQENYLVAHSSYTYLMLPGRGFMEYFRGDVSAQKVADQVACFVDHARGI
jgi:protein SCO1/2